MKIGRIIQHLRTAKKLSLSELASRIQTTPARLESWESEHTNPPLCDVYAISNVLGVPAYTLFLVGERNGSRTGKRRTDANFQVALHTALAKMSPSQRKAIMQFAGTLVPSGTKVPDRSNLSENGSRIEKRR